MEDKEYTITDVMLAFQKNQEEQVEAHKAFTARFDTIENKINPIWQVYSDLQGTKNFFKFVIAGLSLIIGFVVSIKELFTKVIMHK